MVSAPALQGCFNTSFCFYYSTLSPEQKAERTVYRVWCADPMCEDVTGMSKPILVPVPKGRARPSL